MFTEFNALTLATQYSFYMTFSGFVAASIYFLMERNNLTPRYSVVSSLCMMVVAIAAVNYYHMIDIVGLSGQDGSLNDFPTHFRYADWVLTTPLILAVLVMLINPVNKTALVTKLMVADVIMIVVGYVGEIDTNQAGGGTTLGWVCFFIACAAFAYILVVLYGELSQAAGDMPAELRGKYSLLQNMLVIVWMVYPLGYLMPLLGYQGDLLVLRELVYCIADLTSKAGFGIIAVSLAKSLSLLEVQQGRAIV